MGKGFLRATKADKNTATLITVGSDHEKSLN